MKSFKLENFNVIEMIINIEVSKINFITIGVKTILNVSVIIKKSICYDNKIKFIGPNASISIFSALRTQRATAC